MSAKKPTGVNVARLTYLIQCLHLHVISQHVAYKSINAEYVKALRKQHQQMHITFTY